MFVPFLPYQHLPTFRALVPRPPPDPLPDPKEKGREFRKDPRPSQMVPGEEAPQDQISSLEVSNTSQLKNEIERLQESGSGGTIRLQNGSYDTLDIKAAKKSGGKPICITAKNPVVRDDTEADASKHAVVKGPWTIQGNDIDIRGLAFKHQLTIGGNSERVTVARCLFDEVDKHAEKTKQTAILVKSGAERFIISFNRLRKGNARIGQRANAKDHDFIAVLWTSSEPTKDNYIGYNLLEYSGEKHSGEKLRAVAIRIGEGPGKEGEQTRVIGLVVEMNLIDYSRKKEDKDDETILVPATEQGIAAKISGTRDAPLIIRNNEFHGAPVGINIRRQATDKNGTGVRCEANLTKNGVNNYAGGDAETRSVVNNDVADKLHFMAGKLKDGVDVHDPARNWAIHHVDASKVILGFLFKPLLPVSDPATNIVLGADVDASAVIRKGRRLCVQNREIRRRRKGRAHTAQKAPREWQADLRRGGP